MYIGPGGELVMNPIPGVAGVDYPTFNAVPDTGFDCEKQAFPGIYSDTGAQCQVSLSYMLRNNLNSM